MKAYVNIVLTGDQNFVMPMGVTMYSIIHNLSKDYVARFFLFVSGWTKEDEDRIRQLKNCEIEILPMEKWLYLFSELDAEKSTGVLHIHSLASYYRLLMPKILPESVEKCFYVDGDMVVDADLSEIWDVLATDKLLAAVPDLPQQTTHGSDLGEEIEWNEFAPFRENPLAAPYFCSGFFLMNLKLARKLNIFESAMQFLKVHPNPRLMDQDVLNAVCGQAHSEKCLSLPFEWNVFCDTNYDNMLSISYGMTHSAMRKAWQYPKIYHYGGSSKPWKVRSVRHYYRVYLDYWKMSPFNLPETRCLDSEKQIKAIYLMGMPIFKLRILNAEDKILKVVKGYLFGMPLFKKYPESLHVFVFGFPLLRFIWDDKHLCGFLFSVIPFLRQSITSK